MHLKLDELIRATQRARNLLLDLENLSDEEIEKLEKEFRQTHEKLKRRRKRARTHAAP
jgi:low affinity Fe/Cu permease